MTDEVKVVVLSAAEQLLEPVGFVRGGDVVEDRHRAEVVALIAGDRVTVDPKQPALPVEVQDVLSVADRLAIQCPQQRRVFGGYRGAVGVGDR